MRVTLNRHLITEYEDRYVELAQGPLCEVEASISMSLVKLYLTRGDSLHDLSVPERFVACCVRYSNILCLFYLLDDALERLILMLLVLKCGKFEGVSDDRVLREALLTTTIAWILNVGEKSSKRRCMRVGALKDAVVV